jgi:hypothetical protein
MVIGVISEGGGTGVSVKLFLPVFSMNYKACSESRKRHKTVADFASANNKCEGVKEAPKGADSGVPGGRRFEAKIPLATSFSPHVSTGST